MSAPPGRWASRGVGVEPVGRRRRAAACPHGGPARRGRRAPLHSVPLAPTDRPHVDRGRSTPVRLTAGDERTDVRPWPAPSDGGAVGRSRPGGPGAAGSTRSRSSSASRARCRRGTGGRTPAGGESGRARRGPPAAGRARSNIAPTLGRQHPTLGVAGDGRAVRATHEADGEPDVGRRRRRASTAGRAPRPAAVGDVLTRDGAVPAARAGRCRGPCRATSARTRGG